MKKIQVSVSVNPAEDNLAYFDQLKGLDIDYIHCDVIQPRFVEHSKIGFWQRLFSVDKKVEGINFNRVALYKKSTDIPLDVHLMVEKPHRLIEKYFKAGASIITLHYEAFYNNKMLLKALKQMRSHGIVAGIAIDPETPLAAVQDIISECDLILVMGVKPGKSGQELIDSTLDKIKQINNFRHLNNCKFVIEVDGGVDSNNAKSLTESGADILVSGSYIYNSPDKAKAIRILKGSEK